MNSSYQWHSIPPRLLNRPHTFQITGLPAQRIEIILELLRQKGTRLANRRAAHLLPPLALRISHLRKRVVNPRRRSLILPRSGEKAVLAQTDQRQHPQLLLQGKPASNMPRLFRLRRIIETPHLKKDSSCKKFQRPGGLEVRLAAQNPGRFHHLPERPLCLEARTMSWRNQVGCLQATRLSSRSRNRL